MASGVNVPQLPKHLEIIRGADLMSGLWRTQKGFFFFARMQLIPCHHKSQLRRGLPYQLKKYCTGNHLCLPFLFICPKQPTVRITAYLTVILVNHNFKGLGHLMSTHVLIFRLPPTLTDPQFFSPSSFSPSVWDYFLHD